jgi:hypothetical protein
MGHVEMMLAVAGLDKKAIVDRIQRLASGDWSGFSARERAAFHFAHKHAQSPASITGQDMQRLVAYFGPERALDIVWWICRCQYMTRVADAFQLPLEQTNVFDGFAPMQAATAGGSQTP